jgi:hypothetical protein
MHLPAIVCHENKIIISLPDSPLRRIDVFFYTRFSSGKIVGLESLYRKAFCIATRKGCGAISTKHALVF